MKKPILVSACLLGQACRYDGKSKPKEAVLALMEKFELIPVCPETLGGLSIPRLPSEIRGGAVVSENGADVTEFFVTGAIEALKIAKKQGCETAVLKARSPSCGSGEIYDGSFSGELTEGDGITASLLKKNGITVYTEDEIAVFLSNKN